MADIFSKKKRSEIMRAVKSKDSKIELSLRRELNRIKVRYKKHVFGLPGTPDIVFRSRRLVIFVDSCFWHGCRWHGSMPMTNRKFWRKKINRNKEKDKEVNREYRRMGWKVLRFWEHQIKKDMLKVIRKIKKELLIKI